MEQRRPRWASLTRNRRTWSVVLALGTALMVAACGGPDRAISTPNRDSSPSPAATNGNPLSFGSPAGPGGASASSDGAGGVQIIPPSGSAGIDSAMNEASSAGTGSGGAASGAPSSDASPTQGAPAGSPAQARGQLYTVYRTFLTDISGLDDDFQPHWVQSLLGVADPRLVQVSTRAASTLERAKEHGVGTLVDSHFAMKLSGDTATVSDCLDEYHWYVESDASSKPDPGVARGYYASSGTATWQRGAWTITSWTAGSQKCQF